MIGRLGGAITQSLTRSIIQSITHLVVRKPRSLVLDNSSFCYYIGCGFAPDGVQAKMGEVSARTGSKAVP
jgi:hypothetical protein